jgi:hypothetical protein
LGVPSDIAVQNIKEGAKGGKKRRKQCLQGVVVMSDSYGGDNEEEGGVGVARITTTAGSSKRQVQPPTYHFERLFKEACPNLVYPVNLKLRDYGMMKNFMVSGSLNRGVGIDEVQGEIDVKPFPVEDTIMMIYDGCPALHV